MKRQVKYSLSEQQLLETKVKNLRLNMESPLIQQGIRSVEGELRRRGIQWTPHYWLGDEWCCPEGIPGVSIPFYLATPQLIQLERKRVGFVEGHTSFQFRRLLRHEIGHAIEEAFGLHNHPLRLKHFGSTHQPYPKSYSAVPFSKKYVRHLSDNYAQAHPDEDFAETFAVWLTKKSQWKKRYRGWGALEKLHAMDQIMAELKDTQPICKNLETEYHFKNMGMSLQRYHQLRYKQVFGIKCNKAWDRRLKRTLAHSSGSKPLSVYLQNMAHTHMRALTDHADMKKYELKRVVVHLCRRAEVNNMYFDPEKRMTKKEFIDFMVHSSIKFKKENRHRINM